MGAIKKWCYLVFAIALFAAIGCEDTVDPPPPPPPPPQITLDSRFSTDNGLVDNDVYSIFIDSQQRIWMATESGLNMKAPGEDMVLFDDFAGVPNRRTRTIAEANSVIFVGTWGGGMASFDEGSKMFTALPIREPGVPGLAGKQVSTMAVNVDGIDLYIGTSLGLSRYRMDTNVPANQRWANLTTRLGGNVIVSSLASASTPRGYELWVGKKDGGISILRFPSGQEHLRPSTSGIPDNDCNSVAYDSDNDLVWSGYATVGVASVDYDAKVWTHYDQTTGLSSSLVHSVGVRSNGDVWIGSQKGVSRRRANGEVTNYVAGSGLPSERVRYVYVDSDDEVWLCFVEAGVARVKNP